MAFYPNQLQAYSLAGAGAVAGATTIVLKSMLDIDGNSLVMATSFGSIGFGTLEPGNNTLEEQISFTGLVNNANGTTTLSGVKSVTFGQPYTASSGLAKTHAGSTTFVISNDSGFYNKFAIKENDETITGLWNIPTPLANANPATKQYVDNLVSGGSVTNTAIVVTGTAGENVTIGQLLYLKVSDGFWYKASSAASATIDLLQLGIAQSTATTSNPISSGILLKGIDTHQSGLVAGTIYYASTGGAIASSAGTVERAIGQGLSATSIYFDPSYYYIPTANQKAAFAGTSGTPSASNKFVTQAGLTAVVKFGGTGADGVLAITSGTTTLDLAGAVTFVKNYSSISITGTGALAFSNPHANGTLIDIKSQGIGTFTSSATPMIDVRSLGGTGGAGFAGANGDGVVGNSGVGTLGVSAGGGKGTSGGNAAASSGFNTLLSLQGEIYSKLVPLFTGGGGGGGACSSGSQGGNGGRGAGSLYLEIGGALNFTTANGISVAGTAGTNGSGGTNSGGGGGGAGGSCVILYGSLTAASGTIVTTGGAGGTGTGSGNGGGGAANASNGTANSSATGGAGATGFSLIAINSEFV